MIDKHLARLRARHPLSAEEEEAIRNTMGRSYEVEAHRTFIESGKPLNISILVLDGIAARYKDLPSGDRQVTELHVPGDFADLHSVTLKRLEHNLMAVSACRLVEVQHSALEILTTRYPRIARLYWFSTNLDAAIHREWVVSMGRRTAIARLAYLFCELHVRLGLVGLADAEGYRLPINQIDLADCVGLTPVHVNRSLRRLRELGLVQFRHGQVRMENRPALEALAGFDDSYLYLDPEPI